METAVLTDIQVRQMEAESIKCPAHGVDGKVGESPCSSTVKSFGEMFQVDLQLRRVMKTNPTFENFGILDFTSGNGQSILKVEHKLAPWLIGIRLGQGLRKRGSFSAEFVECGLELLWEILEIAREWEVSGQVFQFTMENDQGAQTKLAKGDLGDRTSYERMSISVPTNPGAEEDFWKIERIGYSGRIKARTSPSFAQPGIKTSKGGRKNLAQIVEHPSALGGDIRFFK